MKLRLIAGTINRYEPEDGWRNVHLDINPRGIWDRDLSMAVLPEFVEDLSARLSFRDDTFDEARLHHVLEHLSPTAGVAALAELHRVIKPGGVLDIEVPDLVAVYTAWQAGDLDDAGVQQWLYGEDLAAGHAPPDTHRCAYWPQLLRARLEEAAFHPGDPIAAGNAVRFRAINLATVEDSP